MLHYSHVPRADLARWTFKVWAIVPAVLFFVTTLTMPTMTYYLIGLVTLGLNLYLVAWTARALPHARSL